RSTASRFVLSSLLCQSLFYSRHFSSLFIFFFPSFFFFFFFNDPPTTEIYTLSLHDALPISRNSRLVHAPARRLADDQQPRPAADEKHRSGRIRQMLCADGARLRLRAHSGKQVRHPRSEERRVGKESRARGSAWEGTAQSR